MFSSAAWKRPDTILDDQDTQLRTYETYTVPPGVRTFQPRSADGTKASFFICDYQSICNYSICQPDKCFPSRLYIGGVNHKVSYDIMLQVGQRLNEMETARAFQTIHVK